MTSSLTSRLKLYKANPGTGENVDVAKLNQSLDKIDGAIGATEVTSTTRPATPYPNQLIRETDTRRLYIWNATQSSWDQIVVSGSRFRSTVDVERDTIGQTFFSGYIAGDAQPRITIQAGGPIFWGAGGTQDVNLYRAGANTLKTDNNVQIVGVVTSQSRPVVTANAGNTGRVAWFKGNMTTNGSGLATITHGAGFTPDAVLISQNGVAGSSALGLVVIDGSATSTTVQILARNNAGAVFTGTVGVTLGMFV